MSRLSLSKTKAKKSTILKSRSLIARPEQTEKRVRISNVRFVYLPKSGLDLRDASREETTALRESARRPRINLTWRWIRKHSEECALVHQNRGTVSMAPRLVRLALSYSSITLDEEYQSVMCFHKLIIGLEIAFKFAKKKEIMQTF